MSKTEKIIADYCAENIPNWSIRVSLALEKIDHWRCPLQQADYSLYNEIQDAIDDCANDYDGFLDTDNVDAESIIWL